MRVSAYIFIGLLALPLACDASGWRDAVDNRLDNQDYTNPAPLIGVLTQPHYHKHHQDSQTISGPLVSWIESAGGRIIPIR